MFRSVRFYSVSSPWPDSEQALAEKLAAAAFKPCGSYTERSSGFEAPTGTEGGPLARRVAGEAEVGAALPRAHHFGHR